MQGIQPVLLSTAPASVVLHPTKYQLQEIHGSVGENTEGDKGYEMSYREGLDELQLLSLERRKQEGD